MMNITLAWVCFVAFQGVFSGSEDGVLPDKTFFGGVDDSSQHLKDLACCKGFGRREGKEG
jgi:hypothetical protein